MAQLEQCRTIPDFNNYLAFIFASGEGLPVEVREGLGPPGGGAVVGRNAGARLSCRSARTCGACLWGWTGGAWLVGSSPPEDRDALEPAP